MKPIDASKTSKEKEVYSNLKDDKEKQTPNFHLGQLVRTADIKKFLVKAIQQIGHINYIQ